MFSFCEIHIFMKTFKQHNNLEPEKKEIYVSLEEQSKKNIAAKIATIGAIIGGGIGLAKMGEMERGKINPPQQTQNIQVTQEPTQQPTVGIDQNYDLPYHYKFHDNLKKQFPTEYDGKTEYEIITNAANRNGIENNDHEDLATLFAIRKAENGGHGKQFGVLSKGAREQPNDSFADSLDRQAGHAAYSLVQGKIRYEEHLRNGGNLDFITHFGRRWAPIGVQNDPKNLNANWIKNVRTHRDTFLTPPEQ